MRKAALFAVFCLLPAALAAQESVVEGRIHPSGYLARPALPRNPAAQTECLDTPTTGSFQAVVGDLVEIDYRYLDLAGCDPIAQATVTPGGSLVPSSLGIRPIDEGVAGFRAVAFFFDAAQVGADTVTLDVDGQQYYYSFQVSASPAGLGPDDDQPRCEYQTEEGAGFFRPWRAVAYSCSYLPQPGRYEVAVGDLIEIGYTTTTGSGRTCMKLPKIGLSGKALTRSPLGSRTIRTSLYGSIMVATFFQADKPGKARITLTIGGHKFRYHIVVRAAAASGPAPPEIGG